MIPGSKPGIYAFASLDGSPLSPSDREVLSLSPSSEVHELPGIAVRLADFPGAPGSLSLHRAPEELLAFAGYLDEPEELTSALGVEDRKSPAALAALALERFGTEVPSRMVGEWSLLRWNAAARELVLLCSENLRDPMYWASDGRRVAVAPDMLLLGRLPWIGLALNPAGLLLELSRAGLRRIRQTEAVWKGIHAVEPAAREVFSFGAHKTIAPSPIALAVPFAGSFQDGIDSLNALGRHIVGQNLRRYGRAGFLLSGGIDSTLVTALGAQERSDAVEMFCVTSVAPEGMGLQDEREFSSAVAGQLGLQVRFVAPAPEASAYIPSPRTFAFTGQPVPSLRHYLYDTLQGAAKAAGAWALFDGAMGEMSITEKPGAEQESGWVRQVLYSARLWKTQQRRRMGWPVQAFHARFSKDILGTLPPAWRKSWRAGMPQPPKLAPTDLRGLHPALAKNTAVPTSTPEGLRRLLPFRDRRLVRFAATLPYGWGLHEGQSRAMARAMLRGHVPDSVRLRPRGLPFSPDYTLRLERQAPATRQRIAVFREAGVDRWLDLNWLDAALDRIAAGADPYAPEQIQAQLTAMAAEFLLWCRSQGINL